MIQKELNEISKLAKTGDYFHFALCDSQGAVLMNYNARKDMGNKRIDDIVKRLKSEAISDGIYLIKCKYTQGRNIAPDTYQYIKGTGISEAPKETHSSPGNSESRIIELTELRVENKYLKEKIHALITENAELKAENELLESENEELSEAGIITQENKGINQGAGGTMEILKGLGEMALPVLNTYFDLQSKKTEAQIELIKNQQKAAQNQPQQQAQPPKQQINNQGNSNQAPPEPEKTAEQTQAENEAFLIYNRIIKLSETEPDRAKEIMTNIFQETTETEN